MMMKTKEKHLKENSIEEYKKIISNDNETFVSNTEWLKAGDFFKKFSLYKNYTPVKTSGNTTLISE